ncbi:MAG: helix-turn-helix domain-containing protein [Firmicutes bacterium]|nr:helix-turn-helix domain-containing protein [Bacillota bacterium]
MPWISASSIRRRRLENRGQWVSEGSIARTLRVLRAVCEGGPQTLKALSEATDLTPPTVLRILRLMALRRASRSVTAACCWRRFTMCWAWTADRPRPARRWRCRRTSLAPSKVTGMMTMQPPPPRRLRTTKPRSGVKRVSST